MVNNEQTEKIIHETEFLVKLFLKTNCSDVDLSKLTKISSSTVGRRLTNKEWIMKAFPDNGEELYEEIAKKRQQNIEKGKIMGSQISLLNKNFNRDNINSVPALRFDVLFKNPQSSLIFIYHMALTFKTELSTLADLLQISERDLERQMTEAKPGSSYYFYNLKQYYFDQEEAKIRFVRYYQELLEALKNGQKEMLYELLMAVTDNKAESIIKNRQSGEIISDKDLMIILIYQLKYFISTKSTCQIFGINIHNYRERVKRLLEQNPELYRQYDFLISYYSAKKGRTA